MIGVLGVTSLAYLVGMIILLVSKSLWEFQSSVLINLIYVVIFLNFSYVCTSVDLKIWYLFILRVHINFAQIENPFRHINFVQIENPFRHINFTQIENPFRHIENIESYLFLMQKFITSWTSVFNLATFWGILLPPSRHIIAFLLYLLMHSPSKKILSRVIPRC